MHWTVPTLKYNFKFNVNILGFLSRPVDYNYLPSFDVYFRTRFLIRMDLREISINADSRKHRFVYNTRVSGSAWLIYWAYGKYVLHLVNFKFLHIFWHRCRRGAGSKHVCCALLFVAMRLLVSRFMVKVGHMFTISKAKLAMGFRNARIVEWYPSLGSRFTR